MPSYLKDKITLVIPVRDRHYNLPSIVDYYKNTDFKKIIYDASIKPYAGNLQGFEYHHVGPEFQTISYLKSHSLVKTPYLINCPDDDIMTLVSLEMCVKFLEENPNYSACDGSVVEFNPDTKTVKPAPKPDVYRARVLHDWDKDDLYERLKFGIIECSRSCLHSVVRTEQSVRVLQNFIDNIEITPLSFLDRVYTFSTMCFGPVKTLYIPQHIRMANQRPNADRVMFDNNIANEIIDGYGLRLDIQMVNHIDKKHCSKFACFLKDASGTTLDAATEKTIEIFTKHFEKRALFGGGGYFGQPIDLSSVQMPCKNADYKDIIDEAVKSMSIL